MPQVIGRFAPTPSGPLHLGSLLAALASYLSAKAQGGLWRLRIDDLDPWRTQSGAADQILRCLEAHGLLWDGPVIRESQRLPLYRDACQRLHAQGWLFPCSCSRNDLAASGFHPELGWIHPAECLTPPQASFAWRVRVQGESRFADARLGMQSLDWPAEAGPFVIWRRDDLPSYHLACMLDESLDQITEVVRGGDLLASTHCQLYLAKLLQLETPHYLHLPILTHATGQKLSKQSLAPALEPALASGNLVQVLAWLGQGPPSELASAPPQAVVAWGLAHWNADKLGKASEIRLNA